MTNPTTQERNLSLLCDYYELTMSHGYFQCGMADTVSYFDMFFRDVPDGGGFAIAAGLEQVIEYIKNLHFSAEDIAFLRQKNLFCDAFLDYLADFRFKGDIWAVPEGTPIFPGEPILTVRGTAIEAQLIETFVLLTINHQSLIATKANRIVRAAEGRAISEFGSRRAQGPDGAILGARAAYIGGCTSTACTISDQMFGVPATGTMAHSWVQMFDSEYEAFANYCKTYPSGVVLLIDTYNVLKSGLPNAIRAFDEVLKPMGKRPIGVRLDSGDITYLTKKVRAGLDAAGYPDCKIIVSNSLDELIIKDLLRQGAKVDSFGVGERLITAKSNPVFGGVYKLCAVEDQQGNIIPKIKISENVGKITNPHFKKVLRLYVDGKAVADQLCVYDEVIDETKPLELFDPEHVWKRRTLENFTAQELLVPIFEKGECVYQTPPLCEIRDYCAKQVAMQWDEVRRFENPHTYYVDLSQKLWDIKQDLLKAGGAKHDHEA